ncbi:MAG: acetate--CoA ligase alpha subunit [Candidatus Heimdallarchaeaceae archaeon]
MLTKLSKLLRPNSVAIIGASPDKKKVGYAALKNMIDCGFKGKLYAVNPKADQYNGQIEGIACYKTVSDIPEVVDLAVICVPAKFVPQLIEEIGEKGIPYTAIITAGFKETGKQGAELEQKIEEIARKHSVRIVGPNILGIIDTHTPMNASFAEQTPIKGEIAFLSQSGALLTGILDWSRSEGIGFSSFVSLGNKADLDETDFIEALADDDKTTAILAYLESINRGEEFVKVCNKVTKKKPVIVVKSGRSEAGSRAASSHTGSMTGADTTYDVAFKKCGVIRADTAEELFDMAFSFSCMPIPKGNRVAIITNAGGPGILATDAAEKYGLKLAEISIELKEKLSFLPPAASLNNPIDALGTASGEDYGKIIEACLVDENIDGIVVILTPQAMTEPQKTAEYLVEAHNKYPEKPVIAVFIGGEVLGPSIHFLKKNKIPCFPFPERAMLALASMAKYHEIKNRPSEEFVMPSDIDKNKVEKIFAKVKSEGRKTLLGTEAKEVVKAYGIAAPDAKLAKTPEEAAKFAEEVKFPVVMKITGEGILHKSDIGGVKVNIQSKEEAQQAFNEIIENVKKHYPDAKALVEVQHMAPYGKELITGVIKDPQFGPLVMIGLGGIYTNYFKDAAFGLAPLSYNEAEKILKQIKTYKLLTGVRGEEPSDIKAVIDTMVRISFLAKDFPEITEMDINPFFVYPKNEGISAVDVKIVLNETKE